jgi:hypothetical protein
LVILALNFVACADAGPLQDAEAASQRHDYATALRIFLPLANQGDGMAEASIGSMYEFGHGVPLDFVSAYLWLTSAAAHGNTLGAFLLKDVTSKMTEREIARAEKLEREWKPTMPPLNTTSGAETWLCDLNYGDKTYKQQWDIANGRMTAPRGKGYLRLAHYDDQVIVAFHMWRDDKVRDPLTDYIVIEKRTGNYLEMDNIVDANFGKANDDIAEPSVKTGHCAAQ